MLFPVLWIRLHYLIRKFHCVLSEMVRKPLHTPGDEQLKSAIYAVFGKDFTAGLLPVDYEFEHVKVWGFISKPAAARPNRSMQHFFINGRYVKSKTAMVALGRHLKVP